jgi:HSP20 family protein
MSSGVRYANPFGMVLSLMDDMDQLFGSLLRGGRGPARQSGARPVAQGTEGGADTAPLWYPQIEVTERDGNLVIRADLPGTGKEDIRLEIFDDYLLLEGERRLEEEENRGNVYRSERVYGRFSRSIPLPEGVNPDEVRASFKDGVLEITVPLPNQGQQQGRQVQIQ